MSVDIDVCSNCGFTLKESDEYCPQCGNLKNSERNPVLKFKNIFIFSFIISFMYALGVYLLVTNITSYFNLINFPFVSANVMLDVSVLVFYVSIIFLVIYLCRIYYNPLTNQNIKKFLLYTFVITGLGSVLGLVTNTFIVPVIMNQNNGPIILPLLGFDAILVFLIGSLAFTPLFIVGLLSRNFSMEVSKNVNYPKLQVYGFVFTLSIVSALLLNLFNDIFTTYIHTNVIVASFLDYYYSIVMYNKIAQNLAYLLTIGNEVLLIYYFVTKLTINLEKKSILQEGFVNFALLAIGSFIGTIIAFILYNAFLVNAVFYNTIFFNLNFINSFIILAFDIYFFDFIFSSLYFTLPICILLISIMLPYKKGILSVKQVY